VWVISPARHPGVGSTGATQQRQQCSQHANASLASLLPLPSPGMGRPPERAQAGTFWLPPAAPPALLLQTQLLQLLQTQQQSPACHHHRRQHHRQQLLPPLLLPACPRPRAAALSRRLPRLPAWRRRPPARPACACRGGACLGTRTVRRAGGTKGRAMERACTDTVAAAGTNQCTQLWEVPSGNALTTHVDLVLGEPHAFADSLALLGSGVGVRCW
jgi:hypothetical protein